MTERPFLVRLAELRAALKLWHDSKILRDYGMQQKAEHQIAEITDKLKPEAILALLEACEYVKDTHSESCPVFGTGPDQEGPIGPCRCNPGRIGAAVVVLNG